MPGRGVRPLPVSGAAAALKAIASITSTIPPVITPLRRAVRE